MRISKNIAISFFIFFFTGELLQADPVNKINLGFESGNFDGWRGYTWIYRTDSPDRSTPKVEGIVDGRHTIMNDQFGYDPNTGGKLKLIPNGYKHSAKLGSTHKFGQQQSLSYTLTVDSTNALLIYKFAIVLQDPTFGHLPYEEPRFMVTLYDESGNIIPDCSNYDIYASDARIEGFQTYFPNGENSEAILWRDWTTVGTNLMPYYGKTITIEFVAADCTHENHYGYGYFVVDCMPLEIRIDYCDDDVTAVLSAPSGFYEYIWKDIDGNVIDNVQDLFIPNPVEGEVYSCFIKSEAGCSFAIPTVIARYVQDADFTSDLIDCESNSVQLTNLSTHNRGELMYLWDFGDGNTSREKDPVYTFKTSGMHRVALILFNPPSGCIDTIYQDVESFSSKMVGFTGETTYCPDSKTNLAAYGAFRYEWSTGSVSDKFEYGAPGGDFWLLGFSSGICISDSIHFKISEDPEWNISIMGNKNFCHGSNSVLVAEGAVSYLWNTGEKTDSVIISSGGTYHVTGHNQRGCKKEITLDVTEIPLPKFDFSLSPNSINIRHNLVEGSAFSNEDLSYQWNIGNGTVINGSKLSNYFEIPNQLNKIKVEVTAINEFGCVAKKYNYIGIDVYVPNVFTPNNDGINDIFMPGINLKIVDRSGILIYNGSEGWDGYYKGVLADPDTYFYVVNYTDVALEDRIQKGYVTLIR